MADPEKLIRTMKTDMEEVAVRGRAVPHAERARFSEPYKTRNLKILALVLGILIAIGIAGALGLAYYLKQKKDSGPHKLEIPRSFIPTSSEELLEVKDGDRTGLIAGLRHYGGSESNSYIYVPVLFSKIGTPPRTPPPRDFFETLGAKTPPDFYTSVGERWNIYVLEGDLVLIFESKDWLKTLGSMHRWEATIERDLAPILTKTSDDGSHRFEDVIIRNIDIRQAILSESEDFVLNYSIVLNKFLVITTSNSSLEETLSRLIAGPIIY